MGFGVKILGLQVECAAMVGGCHIGLLSAKGRCHWPEIQKPFPNPETHKHTLKPEELHPEP